MPSSLLVKIIVMTKTCGGCLNLGSHRRFCPHHPDYHPWRRLATMAEDIGDAIGSNDVVMANTAYGLASSINACIAAHPWRPLNDQTSIKKVQ